jgi:hypothetical protein
VGSSDYYGYRHEQLERAVNVHSTEPTALYGKHSDHVGTRCRTSCVYCD